MNKKPLEEEIPVTRDGLREYVRLMEDAIKPVEREFNRMNKALLEARLRLEKMPKSNY